jgi:hypothetical protein
MVIASAASDPLTRLATSCLWTMFTMLFTTRSSMQMPIWDRLYFASTVRPGKSSVRNGVSGRPAEEYMLQTGLSAQP